MRVQLEIAEVTACAVTECAYNLDERCQARAITVGDRAHPRCDTFLPIGTHCPPALQNAGVGACKISECQHNAGFECQAGAISIGRHQGHADCATFKKRP